jgi:hypothetical protein
MRHAANSEGNRAAGCQRGARVQAAHVGRLLVRPGEATGRGEDARAQGDGKGHEGTQRMETDVAGVAAGNPVPFGENEAIADFVDRTRPLHGDDFHAKIGPV